MKKSDVQSRAPDTTLAPVSINSPITADNRIDQTEQRAVPISGTGVPGTTVDIVITDRLDNSITRSVIVSPTGTWSTTFDVTPLTPGTLVIVASSNIGSDVVSASAQVPFVPFVGQVTVDRPIAGDNVVNALEQSAVFLSGTSASTGNVLVSISDGTRTVSTSVPVKPDGTWTATLDASSLRDGPINVTASTTDATGLPQTTSVPASLQTAVPAVALNRPLFVDNILSKSEASAAVLGGTGTPGANITVTLSDGVKSVTTTVIVSANGTWTATLNSSSLQDGPVLVTARATDANGNSAAAIQSVTLDTSGPSAQVTSPISGDGTINAAEETSVTIRGQTEPGASVQITVTDSAGNAVRATATANPDGTFTAVGIDLSPLGDGPLVVTVVATDRAGNAGAPATASAQHVTAIGPVTITSPITGDNIINGREEGAVPITGTGEPGTTMVVSVTDGTLTVSATVQVSPTGTWSASLDVSSLGEGTLTVRATGTDRAGNVAVSNPQTVLHDTTGPAVSLNSPISGDDVISSSEESAVPFSGTAEPGSTVVVTVTDGTGQVTSAPILVPDSGIWSVTLDVSGLADSLLDVSATATDIIGNTGTSSIPVLHNPPTGNVCNLPPARCNNAICEPFETLSSCPQDCSLARCGDGVCSPTENQLTCPQDCVACFASSTCGNTVCEPGENAGSCPSDCIAKPLSCGNGACDPEENAGSCPDCAVSPTRCGDGICNSEENGGNCPADCDKANPTTCGNSVCDPRENLGSCPEDCGVSACNLNGVCDPFEIAGVCSDCSTACNENSVCDLQESSICVDCKNLFEINVAAFLDQNLNGVPEPSEFFVNRVVIYLDLNLNGIYDSATEPKYITDGEPAKVVFNLRPGSYTVRVIQASLGSMTIGYTPIPAQQAFAFTVPVKVAKRASDLNIFIPLSNNLPPSADNFNVQFPSGSNAVTIPGLIDGTTDPNNNIDLTRGFQMVSFPASAGTYSFQNGALTITPLSAQPAGFVFTYQLCDLERLCSPVASVGVSYTSTIAGNASPSPAPFATARPTFVPVILTTPVPTPIIVYIFDDNDVVTFQSSGAPDLVSFWATLVSLVLFFLF